MTDEATVDTTPEPTPELVMDGEATELGPDHMEEFLLDDADDLDIGEVVETTPISEGPEPVESVAVIPEPSPEPVIEPAPALEKVEAAPTPEPAPVQTPEVEPTPAPVAKTEPTPTISEVQERYQVARKEQEAAIAAEHYALTENQARRIDEGDLAVIPEMMARTYMDSVTGAVSQILSQIPNLVNSVLKSNDRNTSFETRFYNANPGLTREAHAETALKFGKVYRQLNPNATNEEFIRDVGAQVTVAFGAALPVAPLLDSKLAPAKGFIPAGAGGVSGATPNTNDVNPFAALATEMDQDDLDLDSM